MRDWVVRMARAATSERSRLASTKPNRSDSTVTAHALFAPARVRWSQPSPASAKSCAEQEMEPGPRVHSHAGMFVMAGEISPELLLKVSLQLEHCAQLGDWALSGVYRNNRKDGDIPPGQQDFFRSCSRQTQFHIRL